MHDVKTFELEKRVQNLERYMSGITLLTLSSGSVAVICIYLLLSQ